jgi:hypothetical protein
MQYKHAILTFCSSLAKYKIKRLYPFYLLRTNTVNKVQLTLNTTLEVTFIIQGEFTPSIFLRSSALFGKIQIRRFDNEFTKLK